MLRHLNPWMLGLSLLVAWTSATRAQNPQNSKEKPTSVLDFKVKDIDGKEVDLSKYKGDVLLIVNTASKCGYTPQYEGLEAIYEKYKDKGFQVLAFPANEFGKQEPGTNAQIKEFCTTNYHVTFPVFSKIVVKGEGIHPLYQFLTSKQTDPKFAGDIPWNFTKFLVDRKGNIIARFDPKDEPQSPKVTKAIESALAESQ
jgi:glutathione peroxidase